MSIAAKTLHGAKVCIIPKPENNYSPLALRRGPLAFASSLLIVSKILTLVLIALIPSTAELSTITSNVIVQLTNAERKSRGLNELTVNPVLTKAAEQKAKDMIEHDYFAHISPAGVTPWFWMQQNKYTYQVAGENLAIDFVQAEDVVAAWMASPSHKDNIVHRDYIETGVAVLTGEYQGGTSTVVVHMFGLPAGATRPTQETIPVTSQPQVEQALILPSPAPALPLSPPPAPIISQVNNSNIIKNIIDTTISAPEASQVTILVNNQIHSVISPVPEIAFTQKLELTDYPDGEIVIKVLSENTSGIKSDSSIPLIITKDTEGPALHKNDLVFIISPATDTLSAAVFLPDNNFSALKITSDSSTILSLKEPLPRIVGFPLNETAFSFEVFDEIGNSRKLSQLTLLPTLFTEKDNTQTTTTPRIVQNATRNLALVIAIIIFLFLILAIIIRINIQHPRMIIQACLIFLMASVLFFL